MGKRIVLFGGTFDPIHHGHLIVARSLAEQCEFERITLVPAARPPHKAAAGASATDRLAMLRLAIEGEALFDICQDELSRTGPSYTLDTLLGLRQRHGADAELCWVVGADMLEDLPSWHRVSQVLEISTLIIATRPPWAARLGEIFGRLRQHFARETVEKLQQAAVNTPLIDVSSTDVRRRAAAGLSIRFLVPESVREYIEKRGIYASQSG